MNTKKGTLLKTTIEKRLNQVRDQMKEEMHQAFKQKFSVAIETTFSIFSMNHTSTRLDGEEFTVEQISWLAGWSEGYSWAVYITREKFPSC